MSRTSWFPRHHHRAELATGAEPPTPGNKCFVFLRSKPNGVWAASAVGPDGTATASPKLLRAEVQSDVPQ